MKLAALSTWLLKPACRLQQQLRTPSGVVAGCCNVSCISTDPAHWQAKLCLMLRRAMNSQSEANDASNQI